MSSNISKISLTSLEGFKLKNPLVGWWCSPCLVHSIPWVWSPRTAKHLAKNKLSGNYITVMMSEIAITSSCWVFTIIQNTHCVLQSYSHPMRGYYYTPFQGDLFFFFQCLCLNLGPHGVRLGMAQCVTQHSVARPQPLIYSLAQKKPTHDRHAYEGQRTTYRS